MNEQLKARILAYNREMAARKEKAADLQILADGSGNRGGGNSEAALRSAEEASDGGSAWRTGKIRLGGEGE